VYIVVSGPPGSGKTTLAVPLAAELGLPLVAKDTIKDALMSVLPVPDVESSKLIGRASIAAMLAVAADAPFGAVLDCNFHRSRALDELGRLPGAIVEVFCRCDHDVAASRYLDRAPSRHPGPLPLDPQHRRAVDRRCHAARGRRMARPGSGHQPSARRDQPRRIDPTSPAAGQDAPAHRTSSMRLTQAPLVARLPHTAGSVTPFGTSGTLPARRVRVHDRGQPVRAPMTSTIGGSRSS
jgi:AAA domain